jgi:hypothetical protein
MTPKDQKAKEKQLLETTNIESTYLTLYHDKPLLFSINTYRQLIFETLQQTIHKNFITKSQYNYNYVNKDGRDYMRDRMYAWFDESTPTNQKKFKSGMGMSLGDFMHKASERAIHHDNVFVSIPEMINNNIIIFELILHKVIFDIIQKTVKNAKGSINIIITDFDNQDIINNINLNFNKKLITFVNDNIEKLLKYIIQNSHENFSIKNLEKNSDYFLYKYVSSGKSNKIILSNIVPKYKDNFKYIPVLL